MSASRKNSQELKGLAFKVTKAEAFAKGTKWSHRIFFYKNAIRNIEAGKPLAAGIYYHKNGTGLISIFAFRASSKGGYTARVVQVDKRGNLSLAKSKARSIDPAGVEKAVDMGKRLAVASEVLASTAFLEANPKELVVFGSKNTSALTGGKEIEEGFYLLSRSPVEMLAEQLAERRKEVAELEMKLEEIKAENRHK